MPEEFLKEVFKEAGMILSEAQVRAFLRYYELLTERNKVMNLTAITEFEEAAVRHFADSCILFSPALSDAREAAGIRDDSLLIDVGSGAGFPGLPLKILKPELTVVLLDALQKRVDFLTDVVTTLDLNRTAAVHARAEEGVRLNLAEILGKGTISCGDVTTMSIQNADLKLVGQNRENEGVTLLREAFDLAVSRAVAHLSVLSEYCLPFVRVGGCFAAYKSGEIDAELREAENALTILGGEVVSVKRFTLPRYGDARSIVFIKKVRHTPDKYPRKAGKPGKSPL
ncbi:MAG: 16S rRNA (guanine(527)-N(7))-methyltransferase RsmG [Lachnospiraceae bacterium]|nr:16S rRNA (guanine(527)-N(7))-methyltransferase RsmG [Lachnospiraceae bacterium]